MSPSVSFHCRSCILFSSWVCAWRSNFFECELCLIASTLNWCLAASHQCSGVGKSFFFMSQSCQKLFVKADKVVVGECKRNDVCFCDRSGESGRDIEAVNTCVNICVVVRIFAGPCKFSYVTVLVTPCVSQVILLCNSM